MNTFTSIIDYHNQCIKCINNNYDPIKHKKDEIFVIGQNYNPNNDFWKSFDSYFASTEYDLISKYKAAISYYEACETLQISNDKNKVFKNNKEFYGFIYAIYVKLFPTTDYEYMSTIEKLRRKEYTQTRKSSGYVYSIRIPILRLLANRIY